MNMGDLYVGYLYLSAARSLSYYRYPGTRDQGPVTFPPWTGITTKLLLLLTFIT